MTNETAMTKLNRDKRRSLQELLGDLPMTQISEKFQARLNVEERRFNVQVRRVMEYAAPPSPEEWLVLERWGLEWRDSNQVVLPVPEQIMLNAEAWMAGRYCKFFEQPGPGRENTLVDSCQRDYNARQAWSRLGLRRSISFTVPDDLTVKVPSTHSNGNLFPDLPEAEIMILLQRRIEVFMATLIADRERGAAWQQHINWKKKISALIEMATTLEEVEEFMPEASQIRPENLAESLRAMTS